MKVQIEEVDLTPALREFIRETAAEEGRKKADEFIEAYKKKLEFPKHMGYMQAAKYMNTSYNTLTKKFIPMGLKVIIIDGYEKITQQDADDFLEKYKN